MQSYSCDSESKKAQMWAAWGSVRPQTVTGRSAGCSKTVLMGPPGMTSPVLPPGERKSVRRFLPVQPVVGDALHRGEVDPLDAAHVHRDGVVALGVLARGERRASAGGAEPVVDHVLVELVFRHRLLGRLERHLGARHEPEEVALPAAVRAVAFDRLLELAFDRVGDLPAVAGHVVAHGQWTFVAGRRSLAFSPRRRGLPGRISWIAALASLPG